MRLRTTALACIPTAAILVLAIASPAQASRNAVSIFQSDRDTFQDGSGRSAENIREISTLGVQVVKGHILWRDVAPARRPANPADPAAYDWSAFDTFVRNVRRHGMRPYLQLGGRAPDWAARRCRGARAGTCRPSNRLFRAFTEAAGRHFKGGDLHVDIWGLWNEPNLGYWLAPQRGRRGVPLAPSIYRRLFAYGHSGLRRAGHGRDRILMGELAPIGSRQKGLGSKMAPIRFLREMACVDGRYRRLSRRRNRMRRCSRLRIRANGFAIHPYTARLTPSRGHKGPRARAKRDDGTLRNLGRVKRALDKIRKRLGTRRLGIYSTEFGFQSNPPDRFGSRLIVVARYIDESEYIVYRSPRIKSRSQYTLFDDPVGTSGNTFRDFEGFQLGLKFARGGPFVPAGMAGKRKPRVYEAYRMPFFVWVKKRRARGRVNVFGFVRAARRRPSFVVLESKLPGRRFRRVAVIRLNRWGSFRRSFRLSRATRRKYRLTSTETMEVREKGAVRR